MALGEDGGELRGGPRSAAALRSARGGDRTADLRVIWPDGQTEEWTELALGSYTTLIKGQGRYA